jgi:hypothetical protein
MPRAVQRPAARFQLHPLEPAAAGRKWLVDPEQEENRSTSPAAGEMCAPSPVKQEVVPGRFFTSMTCFTYRPLRSTKSDRKGRKDSS